MGCFIQENKRTVMENNNFSAGAATIDIHHIGAGFYTRRGITLEPPARPQQLRCLVLSRDDRLTVIFNADWGSWFKFVEETRQIVEEVEPGRIIEVLCFATQADHNIDAFDVFFGSLSPKDKRHDPQSRADLQQAIRQVFEQALQSMRSAQIAVGQGECRSVAANSYFGKGHADPTVSVLRIADLDGQLIAAGVNFACRSYDIDIPHLSGGFSGATEAMVQKIYGSVPVLFFQAGGGDHFSALVENPVNVATEGVEKFREEHHRLLIREYDRLGRMLGGEVCKVLAELEVAGKRLQTQNERWRYTSWVQKTNGYLITQPMVTVYRVPLRLWHRPLPSVNEWGVTHYAVAL